MKKTHKEVRLQNRNLCAATVNASGAESTNDSHANICIVGKSNATNQLSPKMNKPKTEERPQNRNLCAATVNASGAESTNDSRANKRFVGKSDVPREGGRVKGYPDWYVEKAITAFETASEPSWHSFFESWKKSSPLEAGQKRDRLSKDARAEKRIANAGLLSATAQKISQRELDTSDERDRDETREEQAIRAIALSKARDAKFSVHVYDDCSEEEEEEEEEECSDCESFSDDEDC